MFFIYTILQQPLRGTSMPDGTKERDQSFKTISLSKYYIMLSMCYLIFYSWPDGHGNTCKQYSSAIVFCTHRL